MKILFTILAFAFCIYAKAQLITTIAGNGTTGYSGDGGPAVSAVLHHPYKICVDTAGNIYFTDCSNHCVRKINLNGIITTVAGKGIQGYSGDGGAATSAELRFPYGVYADAAGNIFIADIGNARIRKVDVNGIITTIAGTGVEGYSGDGGPATSAMLNNPSGVITDAIGNVFIADCVNHRIRKVATNGIITTLAGTGFPGYSGDGGQATAADLNSPFDLTLDLAGNLLFNDADNYRVRKVNTAGIITTIAGNGQTAYSGDGVPATNIGLNGTVDVDTDGLGNIYLTEQFNHSIRKIDANGIITTIAGTGTKGYGGDGGQATAAYLNFPSGMAYKNNKIYIADALNQRIRMICCITVSAEELSNGVEVKIYPNPTLTELNITDISFAGTTSKIAIINSLGQVVRSISVSEDFPNVYKIDVTDLKAGLYFISIENDSKLTIKLFNKIE